MWALGSGKLILSFRQARSRVQIGPGLYTPQVYKQTNKTDNTDIIHTCVT